MPIDEINRGEVTHTHTQIHEHKSMHYTKDKSMCEYKYIYTHKYRKIRKEVKKEEILLLRLKICNDLFEGIL